MKNDFEILTSLRGMWVATPWDYSSSRWIRFKGQEISDCCYGYGQTIYALIRFEFEITKEQTLKITYLESPAISEESYFQGFKPSSNNQFKEIKFQLKEEIFTGTKNITGREFKYFWKLQLSDSPFPEELIFPYETPLTFYGHREC